MHTARAIAGSMKASAAYASCAAARMTRSLPTTFGRSSGFCVDPIKKKPLNHYLSGTPVLSSGTPGCNLTGKFCQNWDISKALAPGRNPADDIVEAAIADHVPSPTPIMTRYLPRMCRGRCQGGAPARDQERGGHRWLR